MWHDLYTGSQIGVRQSVPIPPTQANALRLVVNSSAAEPIIREFAVFHVQRPVPQVAYRK